MALGEIFFVSPTRVEAIVHNTKVADECRLRLPSGAGRELDVGTGVRRYRRLKFLDQCHVTLGRLQQVIKIDCAPENSRIIRDDLMNNL